MRLLNGIESPNRDIILFRKWILISAETVIFIYPSTKAPLAIARGGIQFISGGNIMI